MTDTLLPDDWDRDWLDYKSDDDIQGEFENFWMDIVDYSNELGVTPSYIEEEFLINGELVKM